MMSKDSRKLILCAVRGQPGSRSTADHAAELAAKQDAALIYLLVIDAQFMSRAGHSLSPLRVVYDQLEAMGDFAMSMLADRARNRGAEMVDYVIRRGRVPAEIRTAVQELTPEILVLGRPVEPKSHARFGPREFDRFVAKLREETRAEIVVEETSDVHPQHPEGKRTDESASPP